MGQPSGSKTVDCPFCGQRYHKPVVRGRFYVEEITDGWQVADAIRHDTLSGRNKTECERIASFARAYVRKWGNIRLASFPYSLDEPLRD